MLQITTTLSSVARIQKARTALLLDHPFFGTLLFRLGARARSAIATMATDGVSLYFNPEFVKTLSSAELIGTLCHEVMHPALQHHTRRAGRSPKRWNMACDYAINPMLLDAGLTLPEGVLCEGRFRGMSAEEIYNRLETEEEQTSQDQDGVAEEQQKSAAGTEEPAPGTEDPDIPQVPETAGGIGQVLDAATDADGGASVEEQARLADGGSAGGERSAPGWKDASRCSTKPRGLQSCQCRLARAASQGMVETIPSNYSWARPNRRHIWNGLYLPGVTSEGVGEVAIAVDCSGSIHARQLGLFEAEVRSILAGQQPRLVHVLYFDTEVHRHEMYQAGQPIHLTPVGGGGTDFRPCFRWLEEKGIYPQTMVFLTDLGGTFPDDAPIYPVIWASTGARPAPFGQVVPMGAA
jgi:predicted metal-dependent peptidase